jgi:hypothetical protein
MLFARAISNGVKWYCPDVFCGPVYVPEEMPEVTVDVQHVEVVETPKVPTLNQKQFDKLLTMDIKTVEKYISNIEEGKLEITDTQYSQLGIYHSELLTQATK